MIPDLGAHAALIGAAYFVTFLVIAGLAAWGVLDLRQQARLIRELEARGARRRSGSGP
jgi:heme exporter protein D